MLNKEQQASVDSNAMHKVIVGIPGGGKSTTIVQMVKKDTDRMEIENMCAFTFTRNAAAELKDKLDSVGLNTKKMFTGTIHKFCLEILTDHITAIGWKDNFMIFDQQDKEDILNHIVSSISLLPKSMSLDKGLKDERYGPRLIAEYESMMQEFNAIDLNMIINKTVELLQNEDVLKIVREKYKAFYVDEFQDTYDAQIQIIQLIDPEILVIIGDPDQAIYEWNDAKPEYLINIKDLFPDIEMFKLEVNYRSTSQIVDTANKLIENNVNRIDKKAVAIRDGDPVIYALSNPVANAEYDYIASHIDGETAVICRKNATAVAVGDYLIDKGIKVNMMLSSQDIMQKDHIKGIIAICRASINKLDDFSLMKAVRFLGLMNNKDLLDAYKLSTTQAIPLYNILCGISKDLNNSIEQIYHMGEQMHLMGAYEFVKSVIMNFKLISLFDEHHRVSKVKDIEEFRTIVKKWKIKQQFRFYKVSIVSFLRWVMLRDIQDSFARNTDRVNIMTVHGAKGLEFDTVFVPHVFESEYPMTRGDNIEEERRLLYVAITRAKSHLYISSCDTRAVRNGYLMNTFESRFIGEMT